MEDNIQTIIIVVISVFLLFIFPVYMAYEKTDDISYALAMRYTQDLVDEVRNKGYLTKYMYDDYQAKLKVTGNTYDIGLQHEYNRYDPVTKYYSVEKDGDASKYTLVKTTTQEAKAKWYEEIKQEGIQNRKIEETSTSDEVMEYIANTLKEQYNINKVEDTYEMSSQIYREDHILAVLNTEKKLMSNATASTVYCGDDDSEDNTCQYAYTMNTGDIFTVTIKNTNTTLATIIYNMVTANVMDKNTRIYVNYGGTILANKWYGEIDYSKLEPTVSLENFKLLYTLDGERVFNAETNIEEDIPVEYEGGYKISFDVKPDTVTELREKGSINVGSVANYSNYNFALGNKTQKSEENMLSVAVGYNGILMMTNMSEKIRAETSTNVKLPTYEVDVEKTKIVQETYEYVDSITGEVMQGVRDKEVKYIEQEQRQRKITDYSEAVFTKSSANKVKVFLKGKSGVENEEKEIVISDPNNILQGLNHTIENPSVKTYKNNPLGGQAKRGTRTYFTIICKEDTISISAIQIISHEEVIISYPISIKDYVNVEIEVKENENGNYTAKLFVDGEKMDESRELEVVDNKTPKIDAIGRTYIGTELRHFSGSISNVKLYGLQSEE